MHALDSRFGIQKRPLAACVARCQIECTDKWTPRQRRTAAAPSERVSSCAPKCALNCIWASEVHERYRFLLEGAQGVSQGSGGAVRRPRDVAGRRRAHHLGGVLTGCTVRASACPAVQRRQQRQCSSAADRVPAPARPCGANSGAAKHLGGMLTCQRRLGHAEAAPAHKNNVSGRQPPES